MTEVTLVLASASPRRAEILRGLGYRIEVHPSAVPEELLPGESPEAHAERLAREKAEAVSGRFPDRWVLAGDTLVTDGTEILGKPRDTADAVRMLLRLQGRTHRVVSGLALAHPNEDGVPGGRIASGIEMARVRFRPFDRTFAEAYVRTGEPMDKAGAYGIQGLGAALVSGIEGDYTAVVGLPVPLFVRLMEEAGMPFGFGENL